MIKAKIAFLLLWFFCSVAAQNVVKSDTLKSELKDVQLADSLSHNEETEGNLNDLLNDLDLRPLDHPLTASDTIPDDIRIDVVMPDPQFTDSLTSDSVKKETLLPALETIDSLGLEIEPMDTLILDDLVMDSTVIDTLKFDSAYYYQQQQMIRDSLRRDSIRLKKLADDKKRMLIPLAIREFNQMIANYRREFNVLYENWDDYFDTKEYVKMNPDFYKFVVPLTYYSSAIHKAGSIDGWEPDDPYTRQAKERVQKLNDMLPDLRYSQPVYDQVERQLLDIYTQYPELVLHNESELAGISLLSNEELLAGPRNENVMNMIQPVNPVEQVTESDLTVFRPNFWTKGGSGYLQFSQNHISENWYKGGESTVSLLSGLVLFANFNNKQGVEFENKLEWKLGFITAPSDTVHSYKVNNDLFRINSKFGLKAISHWYYTFSFDFKTQFFSNYQTNSDKLISAFFSPAELNAGLGMDYKYAKDGVINLSILMTPINYTLYTVLDNEVDPTKFNIEEGRKHAHVFGSRFEANMKWKVFKPIMWETRLSYTTNYEKALAEWENTFTFVVNKYLSTKLFLNARFDDGVARKEGDSYFQLQEILSFGLNYTW